MKPKIDFFKRKDFSSSDIYEVGGEERETKGRVERGRDEINKNIILT